MEHFPTLTETVAALRRGETTSEALTSDALDRIDALNGHLGAFVHVARDAALVSARAADERLSAGQRPADAVRGGTGRASDAPGGLTTLPALLGVPTALKDGHDVAGMPTSWGSLASRDGHGDLARAQRSDELSGTLEAAGAVILGKTQVPEFLLNSYSENLSLIHI